MPFTKDLLAEVLPVICEFLTVKEVCQLGGCNGKCRQSACKELESRKNQWKRKSSRSWPICHSDGSLDGFADDYSFEKVKAALTPSLGEDLVAHGTEEDVWNTVASWCGGWGPFLHARENRPPKQPESYTTSISTPMSSFTFRTPVLLIDVHCDGRWMWTAIHPLQGTSLYPFLRRVGGNANDDNDENIYPCSTFTLGDVWDSATFLTRNKGCRPPRHLITTTADDTKSCNIRVGVVSASCSETLIMESGNLQPKSLLLHIHDGSSPLQMASNSGLGRLPPHVQHDDHTILPDENLLRTINPYVVQSDMWAFLSTTELVFTKRKCSLSLHLFWDARKEEKFHIMLHEVALEPGLLADMIAHKRPNLPPTQNPTNYEPISLILSTPACCS